MTVRARIIVAGVAAGVTIAAGVVVVVLGARRFNARSAELRRIERPRPEPRRAEVDPSWPLTLERTRGDRWRIGWGPVEGAESYRLVVESATGETAFEQSSSSLEIVLPDSALPHRFHKRPLSARAEAFARGVPLRATAAREISFGDDCKHE